MPHTLRQIRLRETVRSARFASAAGQRVYVFTNTSWRGIPAMAQKIEPIRAIFGGIPVTTTSAFGQDGNTLFPESHYEIVPGRVRRYMMQSCGTRDRIRRPIQTTQYPRPPNKLTLRLPRATMTTSSALPSRRCAAPAPKTQSLIMYHRDQSNKFNLSHLRSIRLKSSIKSAPPCRSRFNLSLRGGKRRGNLLNQRLRTAPPPAPTRHCRKC